MSMYVKKRFFSLCLVPLSVVYSSVVYSFEFQATELEFSAWDEKCQALYASTEAGRRFGFGNRLPQDVVGYWRALSDAEGSGAWHYCAGRAYLQRSSTEHDTSKRRFYLERAVEEINFTHQRAPKESETYAEATMYKALVFRKMKKYKEALALLDGLIKISDKYPKMYVAYYLIYKDLGDKEQSLSVLLKGEKNIKTPSEEIFYFIGLEYFKKKELEKSAVYAKKAYDMGFPLVWLKEQLQNAGIW